MKSKLAASISPLSAAVWNKIWTSNSSRSMVALFGRHHPQIICRPVLLMHIGFDESKLLQSLYSLNCTKILDNYMKLKYLGRRRFLEKSDSKKFWMYLFKSSSRAAYSSVIEDDSFSELGPETSDCSAKQIRLVTEKPEYFLKPDPSRKGLATDNRPKSKATVSAPFRASPTSRSKSGENSDASISPDVYSEISDMESAHSVAIKNICSTVGLYELVEASSVFGKVTGALFVNASNGLKCCHIKFESVDSSRQAILAGKISVGSREFPVHPVDAVDVLAVRIKNISQNTSDHDIHRMCKSLGELVGLARMSKDSVDAFFTVRSDKIHLNILKRLNSTVLDDCGWSADILRSNSSDEGGRCKLESQIYDQISGMRRQNMMDKINLEDLETLLFGILHIQEQAPPSDANTGSS